MKRIIIINLHFLFISTCFAQFVDISGTYKNEGLIINIDSNNKFQMLYLFRFGEDITYVEGVLNFKHNDTVLLKCVKPDSLNIYIDATKLKRLNNNKIQIFLRQTPWLIDECINKIILEINNNHYEIIKDSAYSYLVPKDTLIKYEYFSVIYLWSMTRTKKVKIDKNNLYNTYFIDVPEYNRCFDFRMSSFSSRIYSGELILKLLVKNKNELLLLSSDGIEYDLKRFNKESFLDFYENYLPNKRINPLFALYFEKVLLKNK